jgi:peroxiredoxin
MMSMVKTASTMLPLGTEAPNFALTDTSGRIVTLADFDVQPVLLVAFICNHCPFVKHVAPELARLTREYQARGVGIVAINANDAETYPDDSPENMIKEVRERGYGFPYLYDEKQEVAKAYRAACTPDFFVFDRERRLAYRGQMDDSRPGNNIPVTGSDLRAALDAVLQGRPLSDEQRASIGCNIKWRPGHEPEYFG